MIKERAWKIVSKRVDTKWKEKYTNGVNVIRDLCQNEEKVYLNIKKNGTLKGSEEWIRKTLSIAFLNKIISICIFYKSYVFHVLPIVNRT